MILNTSATQSEYLGENLIFLISQPRAGSTMLQRILGGHPDIHTVSEPWLMLYPVYALRGREGVRTEYSAHLAHKALRNFLINRGGEESYFEGIRRMYGYLYQKALEESGKRFFLDKTTRYYLIIPELVKIFPEATFIFLFRNPLAVLKSILKTRAKGNWFYLSTTGRKEDLMTAPVRLLKGIELLGENCEVVHYENLVTKPEEVLKNITDFLGVDYATDMDNYSKNSKQQWILGDPDSVYRYDRPEAAKAYSWRQCSDPPQMWRLMHDYLSLLGRETFERMGYSYEENYKFLEANRPRKAGLWITFPLTFYQKPFDTRPFLERNLVRILKKVSFLPPRI